MALFKMTRVGGHAFNIPPYAIRTLESIRPRKNPHHDDAASMVRYDLGEGPQDAVLSTAFDDLRKRLEKTFPTVLEWVEMSVWEADRADEPEADRDIILFPAQAVQAIEGLDPDADGNDGARGMVTMNFGQKGIKVATYETAEEITEQVEKAIEGPAASAADLRQPSRSKRVAAPKPATKKKKR